MLEGDYTATWLRKGNLGDAVVHLARLFLADLTAKGNANLSKAGIDKVRAMSSGNNQEGLVVDYYLGRYYEVHGKMDEASIITIA